MGVRREPGERNDDAGAFDTAKTTMLIRRGLTVADVPLVVAPTLDLTAEGAALGTAAPVVSTRTTDPATGVHYTTAVADPQTAFTLRGQVHRKRALHRRPVHARQ